MPATSKAQFKFMKAVEEGYIKKPGLSPKKAAEYTSENHDVKDLPERVGKKGRFNRLQSYMKGKKHA
jgi:hypothetical protein